ncbi:MAG: class I SAM-dependent methyltransferase [Candidatus Cloacimonadales bacterium]|nr:class I SAM-dependent methyltransferase [Candidatus Cloacimonadales bacterium]
MQKNKDRVCPVWMAYTFDNPLRKLFHNPTKMLQPYLSDGMTIFDISCGMGHFTLGMAKMLDDSSKIIAVDLQQGMLDILLKKAKKARLEKRIRPIKCQSHDFCLDEKADFALACWVMHETPDVKNSLRQIYDSLKPGGKFLMIEPAMHVSEETVENAKEIAAGLGFSLIAEPKVRLSRALLLQK